jgi:hypothetical protein
MHVQENISIAEEKFLERAVNTVSPVADHLVYKDDDDVQSLFDTIEDELDWTKKRWQVALGRIE